MQVILLAAGIGSRMRELTRNTHKSLLKINSHDSFLSRLLHQLNEYEISKLVIVTGYKADEIVKVVSQFQINSGIVYNDKYNEDTNIYSMKLALDRLDKGETTIIIEADIYLDDLALKEIYFQSKTDNSIWFTRGKFNHQQYGGILNKDLNNKIRQIDIVKEYQEHLSSWYKLLGITTIGKREFSDFHNYLTEYANRSIKQYYLIPWIENLKNLPCFGFDIQNELVSSFNTEKEYYNLINYLKNNKKYITEYDLVALELLKPIEDIIEERRILLREKIIDDNLWTKPIIADSKDNLIMDGHHRFVVAKDLGLTKIPVVHVDYEDVPIWSLKDSEIVTKELVRHKALRQNIYPNKTVKHKFYFEIKDCKIPLDKLR